MGLYDSKLWISDLDEIIANFPVFQEFEGCNILITGCTGLICSAVTDILLRRNITHNGKINVFAAGRDKEKVTSRFSPYCNKEWFTFVPYDASAMNNILDIPYSYIIHGAGNASPNKIIKEPVETMLSNFLGIKNLLDFARENNSKKVLYISSSEVYGKKTGNQPYQLNEYGYIDLLNIRNSYSVGKRAAETLCVSYSDEYKVDTVIVRPGHIYGPTATKSDNRVSSTWPYAVAQGDNIIMKSSGEQIRSYCYCLDCASAILLVLLKGVNCQAYNISNPDSIISIREMAEILVKAANVQLVREYPTDEEKKSFNPMINSSLDSTDLLRLGWRGLYDAVRGFEHTIAIIRESGSLK